MTADDELLREAARKIRDASLRQMAYDPDLADARRAFYLMLQVLFRSMQEAGWSRLNALILLATIAWLTMTDHPPEQRPPEEES